MALWYARELTVRLNGDIDGDYVFATRKLKKEKEGDRIFFTDPNGRRVNNIFVCPREAERILSPDMRLKPSEGPFRLEPLRFAK